MRRRRARGLRRGCAHRGVDGLRSVRRWGLTRRRGGAEDSATHYGGGAPRAGMIPLKQRNGLASLTEASPLSSRRPQFSPGTEACRQPRGSRSPPLLSAPRSSLRAIPPAPSRTGIPDQERSIAPPSPRALLLDGGLSAGPVEATAGTHRADRASACRRPAAAGGWRSRRRCRARTTRCAACGRSRCTAARRSPGGSRCDSRARSR